MTNAKSLTRDEIFEVISNPLTRDFFNVYVSSFFVSVLPDDVKDTFEGHMFDVTISRLDDGLWIVKDRLDQHDANGNKKDNFSFSPPEFKHTLEDAVRLAFEVAPTVSVMNMLPHEFPEWYRKRSNKATPEPENAEEVYVAVDGPSDEKLLEKFPGATIDQAYTLQACLDDWEISEGEYIYNGPNDENHVTIGFTTDEGEERTYIVFPNGENEVA